MTMPAHVPNGRRRWLQRLAWLVAIWMASVASLAIAAWALKVVMRWVGMSL